MRQLLILTLALSMQAAAQRMSIAPGALTNRDILTLAGAGFSEDFIIDTITTGRTQFDTTATALADLVKHAVTERIIRVMMDQPGAAAAPALPDGGEVLPVVMPTPIAPNVKAARTSAPKVVPVAMAMSTGTPYYEWKSVLWGLWRKRVGVGVAPTQQQPMIAPHLGPLYRQVRAPHPVIQVATPPIQYYTIAP